MTSKVARQVVIRKRTLVYGFPVKDFHLDNINKEVEGVKQSKDCRHTAILNHLPPNQTHGQVRARQICRVQYGVGVSRVNSRISILPSRLITINPIKYAEDS